MKKMLLATALWPCLLQDVLNRRLLFKTNRRPTRKTITHHFFVSGIRRRKLSDAAKFVARRRKCC